MMEGDPKALFAAIEGEEKKAVEGIARHYRGRKKGYEALLGKRMKRKKAILGDYYASIARNARAYLLKEHEYAKQYEDYSLLVGAFEREWKRFEGSVAKRPAGYVRFALERFGEIAGKPDSALAGKPFRPSLRRRVRTRPSGNDSELKLFKGKVFADFSLPFIKELLVPVYADNAVGGE